MAFILQESSYIQGAKPERTKLLVSFHGKEKVLLLGMPKLLMEHGKDIKKKLKKLSLTEGILMILLISSLGTII